MTHAKFVRRWMSGVVASALLFAAASYSGATSAAASPSHAQISGTGSSWSANAVNQWVADVSASGLRVDFTGSGSAQGRKDFANAITDFAVSDIGFQGHDPLTGAIDTNCGETTNVCRAFAYEPIVAGGTSFPYQVRVAGHLVTNLRLSGETLAKIFTYKITNWNDPEITADNNGRKLPPLRIIPVVHSEGSGSTAQFTTYLDTEYPSIWRAFTHQAGFTEYYPSPTGGQGIAQSGSDGVMNFVSSQGANGAIGYDEYSYPLAKNFPVAKVLNRDGYFTLPNQYNVAVALTHAQINTNKSSPNYLLQTLNNVYTAPEAPAYPLSSYSYFIIPTAANDPRMTTAKRQTLVDYLYYSVCQGQKEIGPIGYSPLPINLVQASFDQTNLLKAADPGVDITKRDVTTCQNPTFVAGHPEVNRLAQIAPIPPSCDKQGQGPCGTDNTGTGGPGGSGGAGGNSGAGSNAGTGSNARTGPSPANGQLPNSTAQNGASAVGGAGGNGYLNVQPEANDVSNYHGPASTAVLASLAVIELIAVLVLPPLVYIFATRRRKST
jgi:phosphate transport system substrate-binding protein